jgi:ribosome recycling factor
MLDSHNDIKNELEGIVARLSREIALLHSSRATPALVENILVSVYGQKMPINQVASLSAPDARTIIVQPWDTSILNEIQKAIELSHLGMGSSVDEKFIRLTMPQLSQERRKEILKVLGKTVEEARISVRRARDHHSKIIEEAEKNKEMSKDEKFRRKEALQKTVDEFNARIAALEAQKSQEIENA